MPDPLTRSSDSPPPLFGTAHAAGQKAALRAGSWRARILAYLAREPATLFEIAAAYGVPDHCISGRFTELAKDGFIEPSGERRRKPQTECDCEVWRLRREQDAAVLRAGDNYPSTIHLDHDLYDRQELLKNEGYPGIPYARRADNGGMRLNVRIELIECPGCGKPLVMQQRTGEKPEFVCGGGCGRVWKCRTIRESGGHSLLALVMERIS